MGTGTRPFDYGMAELVAFASLLEAGTPVRLTGQELAQLWYVQSTSRGDGAPLV